MAEDAAERDFPLSKESDLSRPDSFWATTKARDPRAVGLTRQQAKRFYDRLGRAQDLQAFYEDRAIKGLLAQASFETARSVIELGCGTGRLAETLLTHHLPADARYVGVDISDTMTVLSGVRLQKFGDRAQVLQVEGIAPLPGNDAEFDRFVSTYVFDLLSPDDAQALLAEAHRLLSSNGLLCAVSLAPGRTLPTRMVSSAWSAIWSRFPSVVGGCRPINLEQLLKGWHIQHRDLISAWGLASEVVIAGLG
jgi:ubiquinone/menaquinone biosynthesis C-methylase UbiE